MKTSVNISQLVELRWGVQLVPDRLDDVIGLCETARPVCMFTLRPSFATKNPPARAIESAIRSATLVASCGAYS